MTSTYGLPSVEANDAAAALGGKLYAQEHNPTTDTLETRLANLDRRGCLPRSDPAPGGVTTGAAGAAIS